MTVIVSLIGRLLHWRIWRRKVGLDITLKLIFLDLYWFSILILVVLMIPRQFITVCISPDTGCYFKAHPLTTLHIGALNVILQLITTPCTLALSAKVHFDINLSWRPYYSKYYLLVILHYQFQNVSPLIFLSVTTCFGSDIHLLNKSGEQKCKCM